MTSTGSRTCCGRWGAPQTPLRSAVRHYGCSMMLARARSSAGRLSTSRSWRPSAYDPVVRRLCGPRDRRSARELDDPAMVIRARCSAAVARVSSTDTGWEELEAAVAGCHSRPGLLAEHAGLIGATVCWAAALHRRSGPGRSRHRRSLGVLPRPRARLLRRIGRSAPKR